MHPRIVLLGFLCWLLNLGLVNAARHRPRGTIRRQTEAVVYTPIQPSGLTDYEVRGGGSHSAQGDYVMQGLGQTISLATQTYGLRDSESFYWGIDGNPLANLTAYAEGEAVRVLSMERFSSVLQTAECSPTSIKLKFTEEVQFDEVQKAWQWVNDADDHYIILVTESAQCNVADGDDTIRQPWHVKKIVFDDDTNIITMAVESKKWDEAFGDWHLRIDSRGLVEQPRRNKARSIIPDIKGQDRFDLSSDFSGMSVSLKSNDNTAKGSITCVECGTHGGLNYVVDVVPVLVDRKLTGHIELFPDNLGATIKVKTAVTGAAKGFYGEEDLLDIDLGPSRILIKGVADIGPKLKYTITGSIGSVDAGMDITTGVNMTIPDNSFYSIDYDNRTNDRTVGWEPNFTSIEPEFSSNVKIGGKISGELRLVLEGHVLMVDAALGVSLAAPTFDLSAKALSNTAGGVCGNPEAEIGAEISVGFGVAVNAYAAVDAGPVETGITKTLFATNSGTQPTSDVGAVNSAASNIVSLIGSIMTIASKGHPSPTDNGSAPITGAGITATPTPGTPGTFGTGTCSAQDHGALICNGPTLFGLCNWGSVTWQRVAFGTACQNNAIVGTGIYSLSTAVSTSMYAPAPTGGSIPTCEVHGALVCNGEKQYGLCNWGKVIWQPVADGTVCQGDRVIGTGVYAVPTVTAAAQRR